MPAKQTAKAPAKPIADSTDNSRYQNLSVKDLLEARDMFHIHLMRKSSVIGTAIGKYRVRKTDINPDGTIKKKRSHDIRTLENSRVVNQSWPCILVFVKQWISEAKLKKDYYPNNIIPTKIYMPDGLEVPICVVVADKVAATETMVDEEQLLFPSSYIGGGFPLVLYSQGVERVATIGCVVSDGNKYYAITNRHVVGTPGSVIYTKVQGVAIPIGKSSSKQLGNIPFEKLYEGWDPANQIINADIGLIEIDDIRYWKTDILGIGAIDKVFDINTTNLTLSLIGCPVEATGGVSGRLYGEITALFYRYKSIGGYEYISDMLIGPNGNAGGVDTHHGDSGAIWLREGQDDEGRKIWNPIAIQWGAHSFVENNQAYKHTYAIATSLSNVLRMLEVDIIRNWNLDQDFTWAALGHYTIANIATQLVKDKELKQLLKANLELITFQEADLKTMKTFTKKRKTLVDSFVPLADVPDLVWKIRGGKYQRTTETSNHFADMDKPDSKKQTLLDKCTGTGENMVFLTPDEWLSYYTDPAVKDSSKGILPFRTWQIYLQMVKSLNAKNVNEFITAAGILAHYVGDACQPLHISYMFNGKPVASKAGSKSKKVIKQGDGVHEAYERDMVNAHNETDIIPKTTAQVKNAKYANPLKVETGKEAAAAVVTLMKETFKTIKPEDIVDTYIAVVKKGDKAAIPGALWGKFGPQTITLFMNGAFTLASIWEGAWKQKKSAIANLGIADQAAIMKLYEGADFIPSVGIHDIEKYLDIK